MNEFLSDDDDQQLANSLENLPPSPPLGMRQQVLAAVQRELKLSAKPRWERVFERAAVLCFVFGITATFWNWRQAGSERANRFRSPANANSATRFIADREVPSSIADQPWQPDRYLQLLNELAEGPRRPGL